MSLKKTILFDLNLLSGSSDLLRNAVSAYYQNNDGVYFGSFENPTMIEGFATTNSDLVSIDEGSYLPVLTYPVRIEGNEENIISDEEWRAYLIGGEFADKQYPGLYTTNVYGDHAINEDYLPYKPSEVERNATGLSPSIVLTTEYFQNYSRYQSYANGLQSELMLPNYYKLSSNLFLNSSNRGDYPRYQYNLIKSFMNNAFVSQDIVLDETNKNIFVLEKTLNSNTSTTFSRFSGFSFSTRTINQNMSDKNTSIRKTDSTYISTEEDLSKIYSLMPYANKLEISTELANFNTKFFGPSPQNNLFKVAIQNNEYEYKFLKLLKETFQNEISLTPATVNFGLSVSNYSIDYEAGTTTETTSSTNIPLRLVDVPTMLLYGFRNPVPETMDVSVINSSSYADWITPFEDTDGTYRHIAADRSLDVLNSFKEEIHNKFDTNKIDDIESFLAEAGKTKYHETMAFRIQKIGGPPTGDSRTENTIQNIWFYNRNEAIKYIDTQVKYDTEYTYKVFSYVLLQGYKYQTTGLVATRRIDEEGDMNCLEFYNPYTGQTSPQLASRESLRSAYDELENLRTQIEENLSQLIDLGSQYTNELIDFTGFLTGYLGREFLLDGTVDRMTSFFRSFFDGDPVSEPVGQQDHDPIEKYRDFLSELQTPFKFLNVFSPLSNENQLLVLNRIKSYLGGFLIPSIEINTNTLQEITRLEVEVAELETIANALASNAQINSTSRYFADFNLTIEPSVKIVEIPLEEKTMRIVDHPPNDFNVSPYHLQDQSNRLAFYLKYDTFSADTEPYPNTITTTDERNEASYKEGKDFVPGSLTKEESVSAARFIEVYRMMEKPISYQSFENNLRTTIDLKSEAGDIASDHFFIERVRENVKYYYTFRAVNENGVAGQLSPIFESELINDGGYVYGLFNQLSEDELVEPPPKSPILAIKNLLNVV
ncbi:MAG: hypothetical protein ACW99F_14340, partial [Candidatus Hodarchaeales archaeon]